MKGNVEAVRMEGNVEAVSSQAREQDTCRPAVGGQLM